MRTPRIYEPIHNVLLPSSGLLGVVQVVGIPGDRAPIELNVDDQPVAALTVEQIDELIATLQRARRDVAPGLNEDGPDDGDAVH